MTFDGFRFFRRYLGPKMLHWWLVVDIECHNARQTVQDALFQIHYRREKLTNHLFRWLLMKSKSAQRNEFSYSNVFLIKVLEMISLFLLRIPESN